MTADIVMHVDLDGTIQVLETEEIDLRSLGTSQVERASHVEYRNDLGCWEVTFPPGTVAAHHAYGRLFTRRSEALAWEHEVITQALLEK